VGLEWDWRGTGVGLKWDWSGTGEGLKWDWTGTGLGLDWESQGVGRESQGVPRNPWGSVIYRKNRKLLENRKLLKMEN
jgi:hypothetical protein